MATISPLQAMHEQAEASFLAYGKPDQAAPAAIPVVETFGELEAEYAAIRKGCVLIDMPQRGAIAVRGADRKTFLNNMLTQELKAQRPFQVRRSFWLNRKGRIEADLRVIMLEDEIIFDLDVLSAARTIETLAAFIIADDVVLDDLTEPRHRLALHGPTALDLLSEVAGPVQGPPLADLGQGQAALIKIADHQVLVDRDDQTGDLGLHLLMQRDAASAVHAQLLEAGLPNGAGGKRYRLRQAGWHAFNIARIEAGCPIFNLDFSTNNLPAESGVLSDRVSFTKGCYLGQEVVARMHSLGHAKQRLVGLRLQDTAGGAAGGAGAGSGGQPITGAAVFAQPGANGADAAAGDAVGAVTSSTRSPMLSDAVLCFAQVKWDAAQTNNRLWVQTDAQLAAAVVQESLVFWTK